MEKKLFSFEEIRHKMLNYCIYQERSHSEVEYKMREFVLIPEAKEEILLFLIRENYLNEERFTRSYIRGKFYQKKWGRNKIKLQIRKKGITEKLFTKCLDEINEQDYIEVLQKLYSDYYSKQKMVTESEKYQKTLSYLISKGYEYDLIREIADKLG